MHSHSVTVWWLKTENNFPLSPDVTPVDADTKSANKVRCSAVTDTRHRTFASQRSSQVFLADGSVQAMVRLSMICRFCSVSFKMKNVCERSLQKCIWFAEIRATRNTNIHYCVNQLSGRSRAKSAIYFDSQTF